MNDARDAFGDLLVGYVLNADPESLGAIEITQERAWCLGLLAELAGPVADAPSEFHRHVVRVNSLGPILSNSDLGLATVMRQVCGGTLPSIESDDEVEALLLECVRDSYPILLLPSPGEVATFRLPDTGAMLFNLSAAKKLVSAIPRDFALGKLFPPAVATNVDQRTYELWWRTGQGGNSVQLALFPDCLVKWALAMAGIHGNIDHEECAKYARRALSIARRLALGETVELPLLVGLSNIALDDEVECINIDVGMVRRPTPMALARAGRRDGRRVEAVLVATVREKLIETSQPRPEVGDHRGEIEILHEKTRQIAEQAQRELAGLISRTRYSFLLASSAEKLIAPIAEVTTHLNPIESGWSASLALGNSTPFPIAEIDRTAAGRVEKWARRVRSDHPASLDIGMRRLLLAASTRLDPMDGFIDAVMCWENLFGEAQETGFKVCGSIAKLLEPDDPTKRALLFATLKKLYDVRSRLVHGASEPDIRISYQHRDQALEIALNAMRAAYDVPGLLSLKNSTERYKWILLDLVETDAQLGDQA
nr:HEPN domain-containing protein [Micromonospora sp. DSM 115978]